MADNPETPEPFSLKRWSQRKRAAARMVAVEPSLPPASAVEAAPAAGNAVAGSPPAAVPEAAPLPPVDSLTFESDYAAFMQPKIAEETRRAALRKLFSDPSFNVMDGLDIYVGDYTQPDPMPAGMLDKLSAVYAMLDPVESAQGEQAAAGKLPPPADASVSGPAERDNVGTESPPEPPVTTDVTAASEPGTKSGEA